MLFTIPCFFLAICDLLSAPQRAPQFAATRLHCLSVVIMDKGREKQEDMKLSDTAY